MITKKMPERIWLVPSDYSDEIVWTGQEVEDHEDPEVTEYILADIAAGDTNQPLKVGQLRWIKHEDNWHVSVIASSPFSGRMRARLDFKIPIDVSDIEEIGPVIRPPADTAN